MLTFAGGFYRDCAMMKRTASMDGFLHATLGWFCCLALLLLRTEASHFRGGIIQTSIVNDLVSGQPIQIEFTYRVAWRHSRDPHRCTQEQIDAQSLLPGEGSLICRSGCSGSLSFMSYYCSDVNVVEDWMVGERTFQTNITWTGEMMASLTGWAWITLLHGGEGWEVRTKINFERILAVGRKHNSSPITKMSPVIKVQSGCEHAISIPVADADSDDVRCRWSESSLSECSGVCRTFPATLDSKTCTLTFDAATYNSTGYYAVALQVEDFTNTQDNISLSSVPLQFLVYVDASGDGCLTKPNFDVITKDDSACIGVSSGSTFTDRLTAVSRDPDTSINFISTQSPPGLTKSALQPGTEPNTWYVDITWAPSAAQQGPNIFCYVASDAKGRYSDQRCITLVVGVQAPKIFPGSLKPTGAIDPNKDVLTIEYDLSIQRPRRPTNIRIYDKDSDMEAAIIDASSSKYITFPESTTLGIHLQNLDLKPSKEYYILLDDGIVTGLEFCGPESSRIWDPLFLTFETTNQFVSVSDPSTFPVFTSSRVTSTKPATTTVPTPSTKPATTTVPTPSTNPVTTTVPTPSTKQATTTVPTPSTKPATTTFSTPSIIPGSKPHTTTVSAHPSVPSTKLTTDITSRSSVPTFEVSTITSVKTAEKGNMIKIIAGAAALAVIGLIVATLMCLKKYCFRKKVNPKNETSDISNVQRGAPHTSNGVPNGKATFPMNTRNLPYVV